ncbi:translation initiation factor IF-2-like [Grus japonensis]|uniref:Translation initiation factor IF-2-like n=1 Tax=Grus japonensis TaxID=30415 RepID=A0ABC9XF58_GRUJA
MRRTDGVPEGSQPPRDRRAAVPPFGHEAAAAEAAPCAPVRYRRCSTALRLRRDSGGSRSQLPAGRTRPRRHRRCSSSARREAEAFPYRDAATSAAAAARKRCNIAMPLPVASEHRGDVQPSSACRDMPEDDPGMSPSRVPSAWQQDAA